MLLDSLIRPIPKDPTAAPDPEDIFTCSLGLIFTDDLRNQHGDPSHLLAYSSRTYGRELTFTVADPRGEEARRKFAHYLWNAGVLMGELVGGRPAEGVVVRDLVEGREVGWWVGNGEEEGRWCVRGERVLEVGAGVGLAGIVSAMAGAEEVVISDYPAPELLANIKENVKNNLPEDLQRKVTVQGHLWGNMDDDFSVANAESFTRILCADCLWMPQEHENLAKSIRHFLSPDPGARAFVIAGFHTGRAKLAPFFEETVGAEGLEIAEIYEMDADGKRREWLPERDGGREDHGERKKWLVIAQLKRQ